MWKFINKLFQAISKNEYTQIAQDFYSFSRRKQGRIASYVTLFTTKKMDKKTSKLGIFFAGNRLKTPHAVFFAETLQETA